MAAERNLGKLLRQMNPVLHAEPVAWCHWEGPLPEEALGMFREEEGWTVWVDEATARSNGQTVLFRSAWITLTVRSDLTAVGFLAAVSRALAEAGLSCNVVSANAHDHLFVPVEDGPRALAVLQDLSTHHSHGAG